MWHNRLGHPSPHVVKSVLSSCNLSKVNKSDSFFCSSCCYGKIHKFPFYTSPTIYTIPLQLIHMDIWGPSHTIYKNSYRYYITFIDSFSRFTWIYMLKNKSDALQTFKTFKCQVELQSSLKIKAVQSDGWGEFRVFSYFLVSHGIVHRFSCPHTHQQNGLVERKHRHIVENGLTLLAKASLSFEFWGEAFRTIVYLHNRLPTLVS